MKIEKMIDGKMEEIVGGLTDKDGIYTIYEADYKSIIQLVIDSLEEVVKD